MINEANERLINEMLSISTEVEREAKELCQKAWEMFCFKKPVKKYRNLEIFQGGMPISVFGYQTKVNLTVYHFLDDELFRKSIDRLVATRGDMMDLSTGILTLTIYVLYGQVCPEYCEDGVRHELLHFYEWIKKQEHGVDVNIMKPLDGAYAFATNRMMNKSNESLTQAQTDMAWAMYWSSWGEQDATVNAYPSQAEYADDLYATRRTPSENDFRHYRDAVERIRQGLNSNDRNTINAVNEYNRFGFGTRNIIKYFDKNLNRFKNALNRARVYAHMQKVRPTQQLQYEEFLREHEDYDKKFAESVVENIYKGLMGLLDD